MYCQTQIWTDKEEWEHFVPMLKASITYLHPSDNGQQVKTDLWLSLCYPLNNEHTLCRYIVQEPLLRNKTLLKCTIQTITTIQHSNVRNKEALSSLSSSLQNEPMRWMILVIINILITYIKMETKGKTIYVAHKIRIKMDQGPESYQCTITSSLLASWACLLLAQLSQWKFLHFLWEKWPKKKNTSHKNKNQNGPKAC